MPWVTPERPVVDPPRAAAIAAARGGGRARARLAPGGAGRTILGSVVSADRPRPLGRERGPREPDQRDHRQEDDAQQVEDLVETDLRGLLADLLVEHQRAAGEVALAEPGRQLAHALVGGGQVLG